MTNAQKLTNCIACAQLIKEQTDYTIITVYVEIIKQELTGLTGADGAMLKKLITPLLDEKRFIAKVLCFFDKIAKKYDSIEDCNIQKAIAKYRRVA